VLLALTCLATVAAAAPPPARKGWLVLRSPAFTVMGDAGQGNLRQVLRRLEQFREALGIMFPRAIVTTPTPTTVIVFKSHKSYAPVKPLYEGKPRNIAGYFLPGQAINYVTLTTENGYDDLGIIYHEYVHLVVNNTLLATPTWFNEGLAEYYRTFEVNPKGDRAALGKVQAEHVLLLRDQFMPLDALLAVDRESPLYNEDSKASIFYAESWALVHYLLLGDDQKLATRTPAFLEALVDGVPFATACERTLGVSTSVLEQGLRNYVRGDRFLSQNVGFTKRLGTIDTLPATPVTEAEAHATLGDLLVHMGRKDDARAELDVAVGMDPGYAPAHASLGMLAILDDAWDDARPHLKQAAAAPSATFLCHYYYALALTQARRAGSHLSTEDEAVVERELRRTIELNPSFADAYAQLAWFIGQSSDRLKDATALMSKAAALSPGDENYALGAASMFAAAQDYPRAKQALGPLASRAADESVRLRARQLLDQIVAYEKQRAAWQAGRAGRDDSVAPPGGAAQPNRPALRELASGETRVFGQLTGIECGRDGIVLAMTADGTTSRVTAPGFEAIDFITYREDLRGQVQCGPRSPPDPVFLTFRPGAGGSTQGVAVAVEFVPTDYHP
jgi:tetratricopeptide (TPR) repeat protein